VSEEVEQVQAPKRLLWLVLVVAAVVVVLDQISKYWAATSIRDRLESGEGAIEIVGSFLKFTYAENTGAAFSIGTGFTWIFTSVAIVVVIVIIRTASRLTNPAWAIALGGLLGGSLGNLIDRMTRDPGPFRGYVVDFIQVPNFPIFNVADMAIVGSSILMVVLSVRGVEFSKSSRKVSA
jgi:signal peptidase II